MLKRIMVTTLFAVGVAIAGAGSVAAKTEKAPAKKVESATQAPQGFCFPAGIC